MSDRGDKERAETAAVEDGGGETTKKNMAAICQSKQFCLAVRTELWPK